MQLAQPMGATIWKGVLPQTTEDIQKNKSHFLWHGSQKSFPLMKTTEKTAWGQKDKRIYYLAITNYQTRSQLVKRVHSRKQWGTTSNMILDVGGVK